MRTGSLATRARASFTEQARLCVFHLPYRSPGATFVDPTVHARSRWEAALAFFYPLQHLFSAVRISAISEPQLELVHPPHGPALLQARRARHAVPWGVGVGVGAWRAWGCRLHACRRSGDVRLHGHVAPASATCMHHTGV